MASTIASPWQERLRKSVLALCLAAVQCAYGQDAERPCAAPIGRIVSLQGTVELMRESGEWKRVSRLDTSVCSGDFLHSAARSRAALVLLPETVVRLDQNSTLHLRREGSEVAVEMFKDKAFSKHQIGKACGAGYFMTRFPKRFKVFTPFLNASVEGTEFQVAMACDSATLTVLEGRVTARSTLVSSVSSQVASGQEVSSIGNQPLTPIRMTVRPIDAVQWSLYYPQSEELPSPADDACAGRDAESQPSCSLRRAEAHLRTGQVVEANALIDTVLASTPLSADALALRSLIQVVKNEKVEALRTAEAAVAAGDQSSRAWLALSYAQQAHFQIPAALASVRRAGELAPRNALLLNRLAELLIATGHSAEASHVIEQSLAITPTNGHAHSIQGFIHLARFKSDAALHSFARAVELDSTDPSARLGQGLALIRTGQFAMGREALEIAVSLDPANSLLRSYLGKAYYEERTEARDGLADSQFEMARQLDPNDPTPYFYDAILKRSRNDPQGALEASLNSIDRNDRRAVHRSRLLLDEDRAARTVSLAGVASELGQQAAARSFAYEALQEDPANFSAHQYLADSYIGTPRHEISRASEALQAQLFQPLAIPVNQPAVGFSTHTPFNADPSRWLNGNDYGSLFERDRFAARLTALSGGNGLQSTEAGLAGLWRQLAFAYGEYHFDYDGFRSNNDLSQIARSVIVRAAPISSIVLHAEYREERSRNGDLALDFDPTSFLPNQRRNLEQDIRRIAAHWTPNPGWHVLAQHVSLSRDERNHDFDASVPFTFDERTLIDGGQTEVQLAAHIENLSIVAGTNQTRFDRWNDLSFDGLLVEQRVEKIKYSVTHLYMNWAMHTSITGIAGISYDDIQDFGPVVDTRFNPKLGFVWRPVHGIRLRGAAFSALKRTLAGNQSLEPTSVAGFNQFFDDTNGTPSRVRGLAVDFGPTGTLSGGIQWMYRRNERPQITATGVIYELQHERDVGVHVTWLPWRNTSLELRGDYSQFERLPNVNTGDMPTRMERWVTPLSLRHYFGERFLAFVRSNWVSQKVSRLPGFESTSGEDSFSTLDVGFGANLGHRCGRLSLEASNVLDRRFQYQDDGFRKLEPEVTRLTPERQISLRLNLAF